MPRIVDFRHWPEWSPWEKLDPALQHFLKPFKASNIAAFTVTPVGEDSEVNWAMSGRRPSP